MPTAIVLVEPALPENVGAAARVMASFGLADLRLVAPEAPHDHPRAVAAATHGASVLAGARVYASVAEAVADRRRVWATSARPKELVLPTCGPRALGASLRAAEAAGAAPAVLFGPERTGLRYEHLRHAHALVHAPTDPSCPALNLAQAVALVAWERWAVVEGAEAPVAGAPPALAPATAPASDAAPPAPLAAFDAWFDALAAAVDGAGWLSDPVLRPRALRNLRAALLRAGFTDAELHSLHGVVRALTRGRRDA